MNQFFYHYIIACVACPLATWGRACSLTTLDSTPDTAESDLDRHSLWNSTHF